MSQETNVRPVGSIIYKKFYSFDFNKRLQTPK